MQAFWFLWAGLAFLVAFVSAPLIARFAQTVGVVDRPTGEAKKHHAYPIPLLGGLSIFLAVCVPLIGVLLTSDALTDGLITATHYIGFMLGGAVLMLGGFLDDKWNLPPRITIWFPVAAALVAVLFGIGADKLTNPFGSSPIELQDWHSSLLTFVWLLVVMYTMKFLDGMDGLATGVGAIGAFMVMLLTLTVAYFQPDVGLLAFISFAALIGFLLWNIHPAVIFLGEGGSTFVGYLMGILAVIGGGKLGTALLVLSIPFLDAVWVVVRRLVIEHRSPTQGDRKHLHHRLMDIGLTQREVVLIYYAVAAISGTLTLFLQSREKVIAFGILALVMIIAATFLAVSERKRSL